MIVTSWRLLLQGMGIDFDQIETRTALVETPECPSYQHQLGRADDKDENYTEVFKWVHQAAEQGDVNAQANLGWMYEGGIGVERSETKAMKWYRKAAEQGHANAQISLSDIETAKSYRKAADQGYTDAKERIREMTRR